MVARGFWFCMIRIRYPEYSVELEKEKHPDWNAEQVYLQARKNFNISALNFFAETLKTLTTLRPKVCIIAQL